MNNHFIMFVGFIYYNLSCNRYNCSACMHRLYTMFSPTRHANKYLASFSKETAEQSEYHYVTSSWHDDENYESVIIIPRRVSHICYRFPRNTMQKYDSLYIYKKCKRIILDITPRGDFLIIVAEEETKLHSKVGVRTVKKHTQEGLCCLYHGGIFCNVFIK